MTKKYWGNTGSEEATTQAASEAIQNATSDILVPQASIHALDNSINFYAEVGGITNAELNRLLRELDKRLQQAKIAMGDSTFDPVIHLRINSYGGEIFSGLATVDVIRSLTTKVYTYIEGAAASAATLISIAGKKRFIGRNSFMLIHQLSSISGGTFDRLEDEQANNRRLMTSIKNLYKQYTKIPMKELDQILKHDLWFDAETCLKYGLVDEIL